MAISASRLWGRGAVAALVAGPVAGTCVGAAVSLLIGNFDSDAYLPQPGEWSPANAVMGAVVGAVVGLVVGATGGVVVAGLFALAVSSQQRLRAPAIISVRAQASLIGGGVLALLVFLLYLSRLGPGEVVDPFGLLVVGFIPVVVAAGLAAVVGPRLVERELAAARCDGPARTTRPNLTPVSDAAPIDFPHIPPIEQPEKPVARVVVDVMLKPEILDPQGQAVLGALTRLGHSDIVSVRQGKRFEIVLDAAPDAATLDQIASTLLANSVIEDYTIHVEGQ